MSLKTYDRELDGPRGVPIPWRFLFENGNEAGPNGFRPGEWVTDKHYGGRGMVVAYSDEQMTILWSVEPRAHINFPTIRRAYPQPIMANQIVSIGPMTLPTGLIFFMDYELDRKCTQGPWWSKTYYRTKRWLKSWPKMRSLWSRLRSSLRSRSTPKLTSAEPKLTLTQKWARDQVTPDQTKAIVDEWVNRNAAKK